MDNRQRGIGSIPVRKLQSGGFTGTDEDYRNAYELSRPAPDYGPPRPVTASPIANIGPGMYYSLQQPSPNLSHSEYLKALAKDPEFIKFKEDNPHAAAEFENMNPAVENRTFNRAKAFEPFHTREQISPDQQFDVATQTFFTPRKNWAGTKIDEYGRAGQEKQLENVYRQLDAIDQLNTTQARNAGRELLPSERMRAVGIKDDFTESGPGILLYDPAKGRGEIVNSGSLSLLFERGDPAAAYEQAKNSLPYYQQQALLGIEGPTTQAQERRIVDTLVKNPLPTLSFMEYGLGQFAPPNYGLDPNIARRREENEQREIKEKPLEYFRDFLNLSPYQGGLPTIYQFPELTTIKPIKPLAAGGAVDASDDPMVLYAQRASRPGVGATELDAAAHQAELLRDYNVNPLNRAAYTPGGRQLGMREFTGKYQTSGDPIYSEDGSVPANMPSVSQRPAYKNTLSTQQLFDLLALVSGDVPKKPPVQRFFTGGIVDPAETARKSYAGAQDMYAYASKEFGAQDPRTQSALANMRASQAQMDQTLAALAKPTPAPAAPPPALINDAGTIASTPSPITPPAPTYAQPTPSPEPGGIYPAVMYSYIDPKTGAVDYRNAGRTPPAGMIGATNPNIYGGQQNEFIGERGLFAKGSAADLRPIMNTVLAGKDPLVGAVTVDQNIGDVRLAGKSTDYSYSQAGNQLRVFDKNNNLVSSIAVQGDQDGTKLTFDDGSTFAKGVKNAAGSYEGGLQIGGVAAGAFKGLPPPPPPPGGGTPTVVGGGGNDGIPTPISPEVGVPDDPLPDPFPLPPSIPPYEEGKPDPRIVLGDIASRNVVDTRIPRADTVFANSPVERTFDPVSQTFRYPSSPTKTTPATGEFMSQFVPGNVTLRRPQLLNITRGDVPSYDQKTGTYTAPALSPSQYNAKMREQSLNIMNQVLSGKTYTTAEYYALLAAMRNGSFGDPSDPNFKKNMQEAVDRYVAARAAAATPPPAPKTETITGGTGNDTIKGGTGNDKQEDTSGD